MMNNMTKNSHPNCSAPPASYHKSLYAILDLDPNSSATTTAASVGEAYDRVSTLQEIEAAAGISAPTAMAAQEALLGHAHRVLSHPGKRALYDVYGDQVWDLVVSHPYIDVILDVAGAGDLAPTEEAAVEAGEGGEWVPLVEGAPVDGGGVLLPTTPLPSSAPINGVIDALISKFWWVTLTAVVTTLTLLQCQLVLRAYSAWLSLYPMAVLLASVLLVLLFLTLRPSAIARPTMAQLALQLRNWLYLGAFVTFAFFSDSAIGVGLNLCILAEIVGLIHSRPSPATVRTQLLAAALKGRGSR